MLVILLLLTLASIALSVTTFSRLISYQSKLVSQPDKYEDKDTSNLTQLIMTQSNISETLTQIDSRINIISEYAIPQTKSSCGPGLWWRASEVNPPACIII